MRVIGVTSLVDGSPYSLKSSRHVFFCDFDSVIFEDVFEETKRLHEKWGIDLYILQSSIDGFHLVSFDVLPPRLVQSIAADVRLENDYPLLSSLERMADRFLTLRVSMKAKKSAPVFVARFVRLNNYLKSRAHVDMYRVMCGVSVPKWYEGMYVESVPYMASYNTHHRLK